MSWRPTCDTILREPSLAIFLLLTLLGLMPGANTLFGLVPLFSHDIWLHALTTLASAYFGFSEPEPRVYGLREEPHH